MQLLLFLAKWREAFNIYIKYYGVKGNSLLTAPPLAPIGGATMKNQGFFIVGGENISIV